MRHCILIITIFLFNLVANAQDINYPQKKLIESGNFGQAESLIMAALEAAPDDCANNFAAYELFIDSKNSNYDYLKAYKYLLKSKDAYNKAKDKSKLLKANITAPNINKEIIKVAQIALDRTLELNTFEAYKDFLARYPMASVKQKKIAEDKIAISRFNKNYVANWDTLKWYSSKYFDNQEFVSVIQDSMYNVLKDDPQIDRIKFAYTNFKKQALRDSCVLLLHKVYEECGTYNFSNFWTLYSYLNFKDLKSKDDLVNETYKSGDMFKLTIDAAPYRVAYDALLELLKGRINSKDWDGVLYKLGCFYDYFGDDSNYQNLKKLVSSPYDTTILVKNYTENSNVAIDRTSSDTTLSSDGNVMIIAINKQNSSELVPSKNLFVSIRDDKGQWGKPFEIGNKINSPATECSPFLFPDMRTLYFASNGHDNLGGTDIFMSRRIKDDSWTDWTEPVNIGKEINSGLDEKNFRVSNDGSLAYFSRTDGKTVTWHYMELPKKIQPKAIATITGKLVDPTTGKPVKGTISWEDLETHQIIGQSSTSSVDGTYTICLPVGKNYGYYISDTLLFPTSNNIDLRNTGDFSAIKYDIKAVKTKDMIEKQIPIVLNNLFFNPGQSDLLQQSISELQRVYNCLKGKNLKVEISGHTDNVGDAVKNLKLSEERAKAVKEYLVSLGYNADLLTTIGCGKNKPIAPNTTEEGRQKNRRVEMKVIK